MLPFIEIFGKTVPMYAVMAFLGAAVMCAASAVFARVRKNIPADDIFYMLLYAGIGCLIGAKVLYLLISVDVYWLTDKSLTENLKYWLQLLMSGGLVFYG
ncbi:MAG: prolipoprotein diacylglyceryl transferase family protein, partial [Oscillospiraceae bacterium]